MIRRGFENELSRSAPFPFREQDLPRPDNFYRRKQKELVQRCAGIVLVLGLTTLLSVIWGNPRFSPASRQMDGELFRIRMEEVRTFLIDSVT